MAKRKRKKRGLSRFGGGFLWQRHPTSKLETAFEQADALINAGRAYEAVTLLEPYLASHSKEAELHYYIGYAHVKAGDFWGGLVGYERALDLSGDTGYWLPLASLYLQVGMNAHALNGFRQVLKHQVDTPDFENIPNVIASLEEDVAEAARQVDIPVKRMEEGLRYLENGQRALNDGDYQNCINANRQAIRLLKDWPPPHNNLSLALFFDGQPQEALNTAQRVLIGAPNNLQALSNSIRFLAWTGQKAKALDLWTTLQPLTPQNNTEFMKKAEATRFQPQEMAVFNYAQARVSMYREEFEAARTSLEMALEIWPDYEAAQDLLDHLETVTPLMAGFKSMIERQRQQHVTRRTKRQRKLTTLKPSLAEALSLYSKEVLTGMGRVVIRGGGWSALRKAELLERIIAELSSEDNLSRLVAALIDAERRALREVLENDGMMVWDTFEDRYDSDLEESPYWQYHTPKTVMGRLRLRGLLVEATVDKQLLIVVPLNIRQALSKILTEV